MTDAKNVTFDVEPEPRGADEASLTVSGLKNIIAPESEDNIRVSKLTGLVTPQPEKPKQRKPSHKSAFETVHDYVCERAKSFHPHDIATAKQMLKKYDADGDGSISKEELMAIVVDLRMSKKESQSLWRIMCLLSILLVLVVAALFGVSFAAGEALKESHVRYGQLLDTSKAPVNVQVGSYEYPDLFGLAALSRDELAEVNRLDVVVDGRGSSLYNDVVEASFSVAGVVKSANNNTAFFHTSSGALITIDADAKAASITIGGTTLPIAKDLDEIDEADDAAEAGSGATGGSSRQLRHRGRQHNGCMAQLRRGNFGTPADMAQFFVCKAEKRSKARARRAARAKEAGGGASGRAGRAGQRVSVVRACNEALGKCTIREQALVAIGSTVCTDSNCNGCSWCPGVM